LVSPASDDGYIRNSLVCFCRCLQETIHVLCSLRLVRVFLVVLC